MPDSKAIVVGAGFGGLTAASLLAREGFDVDVVEKLDQPGGRATVWEKDGFVFDLGPSWYLMPEVFEKFFSEFGRKPSDYYELVRLDPHYRVFFSPQDVMDVRADLKENLRLFEKREKGGAEKLRSYLDSASYQYNVAMNEFIYKEYRSMFDFMNRKLMVEGTKLHIFESLDKYASRYIKDPDLRKILEYNIVFLGGTPKNSPALYALMSHVDFNLGVWYPKGGMGMLSKGFHDVAVEQGVKFHFNTEVKKILTEGKKVSGVETSGGRMEADLVVVNADYPHAELDLLEKKDRAYKEKYWKRKSIAPSSVLFYVGLDKELENVTHHNLYFAHEWEKHFETIFDKPSWPDDPSYYVCCPSKTDETVAPEGKENLFFLVPVAPGLEDPDKIREQLFEKVIRHFEKLTGESVLDHIVVKRIFSHRDFKDRYNAYKGTALGFAHTLMQTAVFRPSHYSKKVKNLFYTGHYTHPGIGVPMVIISSQILAKEISKTWSTER